MAITATCDYSENITLPTGYANPTLPVITAAEAGTQVDYDTSDSIASATDTVTAAAIISAMETYLGTTFVTEKNLGAAGTFNINATILSFARINTGSDTNAFTDGSGVYRITFTYEWN